MTHSLPRHAFYTAFCKNAHICIYTPGKRGRGSEKGNAKERWIGDGRWAMERERGEREGEGRWALWEGFIWEGSSPPTLPQGEGDGVDPPHHSRVSSSVRASRSLFVHQRAGLPFEQCVCPRAKHAACLRPFLVQAQVVESPIIVCFRKDILL